MGIWNWLVTGEWGTTTTAPTTGVVSPWASQDSLETALVGEIFGVDPDVITRDTAMRVPGLKRAIQVHADVVAAPLVQYARGGVKVEPQPRWLQSSDSGIAPLIRTKGLVRDLALEGHALLGCRLDSFGQIDDAIHVPTSMWKLNNDATITINEAIAPAYRQKLIYIPLGTPGILTDAIDTIRQARALDIARTVRLSAPPAATELHLNDSTRDDITAKEKEKLAKNYSDTRRKFSVSVTPSYLDVKENGAGQVDLFESATNSIRLDIANHASVPASVIEGAKTSGGGGDMTYTGKGDERSELYDLGSRQFADAITARLSLDDVCGEGQYIAFDRSADFAVPTPTTPPVLED